MTGIPSSRDTALRTPPSAARPVDPLPALPAIVPCRVSHARRTPIRHRFTYRHLLWLVDLEDLPVSRNRLWLSPSFPAGDHLDGGRLGGGIRGDLCRFLASQGERLDATDRVLMLAGGRRLGHAFDPLTVLWVLDSLDRVRHVVFEVHNTYSERHTYLLDLDEHGRGRTRKAFYVSPFNDTRGDYDVSIRLSADNVAATVVLHRDGALVFGAGVSGSPRKVTRTRLLVETLRNPFPTHRVSALIRLHGGWLWARRLPISPRPSHGGTR